MQLTQLAQNCNLLDLEDVKAYIAIAKTIKKRHPKEIEKVAYRINSNQILTLIVEAIEKHCRCRSLNLGNESVLCCCVDTVTCPFIRGEDNAKREMKKLEVEQSRKCKTH